jgi:hypothetical protein
MLNGTFRYYVYIYSLNLELLGYRATQVHSGLTVYKQVIFHRSPCDFLLNNNVHLV